MNINELTENEALELLNTDFGEDMEKQASAIVEAEEYYEYGSEMAKEAAANLEANYAEQGESYEYGEEKLAAADQASELIQEGFVSELMKLGEANYGDPMIYLEEMAKEAGLASDIGNAFKKSYKGSVQGVKDFYNPRVLKEKNIRAALDKVKADAIKGGFSAKKTKQYITKATKRMDKSKYSGQAAKTVRNRIRGTQAAAGLGLLGTGGYGAYKLSNN